MRFTLALKLSAAAGLMLAAAPNIATAQLECLTKASADGLASRRSPLDSVNLAVGDAEAKICYGRPSARGRTMIGGGAVPFGQLWRTGANEPMIIRTPVAVSIAGVDVDAGTYSIYTVPNENEWTVIVNRSYSQWGHEGQYTAEVQAQEVGRGTATVGSTDAHIDSFTVTTMEGYVVFEWENTRVTIPVMAQ